MQEMQGNNVVGTGELGPIYRPALVPLHVNYTRDTGHYFDPDLQETVSFELSGYRSKERSRIEALDPSSIASSDAIVQALGYSTADLIAIFSEIFEEDEIEGSGAAEATQAIAQEIRITHPGMGESEIQALALGIFVDHFYTPTLFHGPF